MIEYATAILAGVAFTAFAFSVWAASRVDACESRIRAMEIQVAMLRGEHKPETPSRN
jgi:hypothetical protein